MADFWVPHEKDNWNFQHMLDLRFFEASKNLSSFRQLLFSLFHGGDQRKKSENPKKCQMSGIHIWESCSPLWWYDKKNMFWDFVFTFTWPLPELECLTYNFIRFRTLKKANIFVEKNGFWNLIIVQKKDLLHQGFCYLTF